MRGAATVAFLAVAMTLGAACADSEADVATAPQATVPVALVPPTIDAGGIKTYPRTDKETTAAFADTGERALWTDGKLFELRQGARLVGALQLTSVVDKLDLADRGSRDSVLRQIMPGAVDRLEVRGVPVWVTTANDKVVYLWFNEGLFQVLQLKGSRLEPEAVLTDVLRFQLKSKAWRPLPPSAYEEPDDS